MKSFFGLTYGNGFKKTIDVYQIKRNRLNFLFGFEVNTQSFKGYESATMNNLAVRGYIPKSCTGYYLETKGDFYIDVRRV